MYIMKRYTVAQARERLADVLNEAERSGSVVIERRGVQYVVRATRKSPLRRARRSVIETLDQAVAAGQWQWRTTPGGVRFSGRRRRP
jgi:hypothetical protein